MSEKKHELYLISFALVLMAALILYNVFNTPEMNAIKIINYETASAVDKGTSDIAADATRYVPKAIVTEKKQISTDIPSKQNDVPNKNTVNINTASVEELITLAGIGQVKAQAIINYRIENGKFIAVEDLLNVKGIGEKTFQKIKDSIIV